MAGPMGGAWNVERQWTKHNELVRSASARYGKRSELIDSEAFWPETLLGR
jgi:hypothetical protein